MRRNRAQLSIECMPLPKYSCDFHISLFFFSIGSTFQSFAHRCFRYHRLNFGIVTWKNRYSVETNVCLFKISISILHASIVWDCLSYCIALKYKKNSIQYRNENRVKIETAFSLSRHLGCEQKMYIPAIQIHCIENIWINRLEVSNIPSTSNEAAFSWTHVYFVNAILAMHMSKEKTAFT